MDTLQLLSQALRGAIIAPPGKLLFVADYAGIEARVILWVASDEAGMDMFRNKVDTYCDMATAIYGYPVIPNPSDQPPERRLGKEAVLGCGYQMGWQKFQQRCAAANIIIDDEMAQRVVAAYREKYWRVKQLWWDIETAAGEATLAKDGEVFECGVTKWFREGQFLYCQLPSGRRLAYPDPKIKMITTSWGARKNALTFMGVTPMSRKWMRQTAFGGSLTNNTVQAISRDLMANALKTLEHTSVYKPILTVHDELIAEAHKDHGTVKEFVALVGQCPEWSGNCPIAAEGWAGKRYRK